MNRCEKCGKPTEREITVFGQKRIVSCMCDCEAKEYDMLKEGFRRMEEEIDRRHRKASGIPDREYAEATFDNAEDSAVIRTAKRYAESFDGKTGMILYGPVGTGKTFAAACIANHLIDKGKKVLLTNMSRVEDGVWEDRQGYIASMNVNDLLILDDFGTERSTEYVQEIVQEVIDSRYRSGKAIIITTNLTGEQLKAPDDVRKQRVFSRIYEMCVPVKVDGTDRRKQSLKKNYEEKKEVLGL